MFKGFLTIKWLHTSASHISFRPAYLAVVSGCGVFLVRRLDPTVKEN